MYCLFFYIINNSSQGYNYETHHSFLCKYIFRHKYHIPYAQSIWQKRKKNLSWEDKKCYYTGFCNEYVRILAHTHINLFLETVCDIQATEDGVHNGAVLTAKNLRNIQKKHVVQDKYILQIFEEIQKQLDANEFSQPDKYSNISCEKCMQLKREAFATIEHHYTVHDFKLKKPNDIFK